MLQTDRQTDGRTDGRHARSTARRDRTHPLYGALKAGSESGLAVVVGRKPADVDGHGQVEFGQLTGRVTFDRAAAVHRQNTQLVDTVDGHTVPRVQVHTNVAPACTHSISTG